MHADVPKGELNSNFHTGFKTATGVRINLVHRINVSTLKEGTLNRSFGIGNLNQFYETQEHYRMIKKSKLFNEPLKISKATIFKI